MQLKTHAILASTLDTLSATEGTFSIVATIPTRCFHGRDGFSTRVDLEYELENQIGNWQVKRQCAGQISAVGALPEDAYVYTLWPTVSKEQQIIRRLFYRTAVKLGIVGIHFFTTTQSGSMNVHQLFRRVH